MRNLKLTFLFLSIALIFASCIPRKKYDDALLVNSRYKKQTDSLRTVADENRYALYDLQRKEVEMKKLQEQLTDTQEKFRNVQASQQDIQNRYDELLNQNKLLLSNSSSQTVTLTQQLSEKQILIDQCDREKARLLDQIAALQMSLQGKEAEVVAALNADNSSTYKAQIEELRTALAAKDAAMSNLRTKLNQALNSFSAADLTVSEANGKIYVSLSQNLIFASGSDQIDWKGKQAIQKLAEVLNNNPDIDINVEGHTDPDGTPEQNWNLSVRRATAVVKVLTDNRVDPKRIIASGRAFYFPVASNSTADGKAKNRRTEIILSPKLDKLYELINAR